MTLDDLHAAMVAVDDEWTIGVAANLGQEPDFSSPRDSDDPDATVATLERLVLDFGSDSLTGWPLKFYRAAKVYLIARDEGLEAAMLWKLTNG